MTHVTVLNEFLDSKDAFDNLFELSFSDSGVCRSINVNKDKYVDFIKLMYTSDQYRSKNLSFDEVRKLSVLNEKTQKQKPARNWLPPRSVLVKCATLLQCNVDYMLTAGYHSAESPQFLNYGCLKKGSDGSIQYDFGPDVRTDDIRRDLSLINTENIIAANRSMTTPKKKKRATKRTIVTTPQKNSANRTGQRRKSLKTTFQNTSTPSKK